MTDLRSEETLAGLVALALVPIIAWTIRRGLRSGALPIGRAYVRREERARAFNALLVVYGIVLLLIAVIAADLLLNLGIQDRL